MVTVNTSDISTIGSATMQNGDFLTFDALPNNRFSLIFPKLPNVQFFLQSFEMPAVSVNNVEVATRFVDYNQVGEKLIYQPFTLSFLVDKYSRNWASVFNWMKAMSVGGSSIGFQDDVLLMIDGKESLRFYGAWPTSLSGYNFDSTVDKVVYVKASVTLNYDYFSYLGQFATVDSDYS